MTQNLHYVSFTLLPEQCKGKHKKTSKPQGLTLKIGPSTPPLKVDQM